MEDAARWMLNEVLPLLRQHYPTLAFYIVGNSADAVLADVSDPGVTFTGLVDTVLPYLCHVDVALVPLRFESGSRFKILEAGICGVPVVSTTMGAEGLPVVHERHLLLADTPREFASAILRLIDDRSLARTLGQNLKALVEGSYTVETLAEQATHILRCLERGR